MSCLAVKYLDIASDVSQWSTLILRQMSHSEGSLYCVRCLNFLFPLTIRNLFSEKRNTVSSSCNSSPFSAHGPYCLTSVAFRMTAHTDLSSAFFLRPLTTIDFRSFSTQSNHLNFGPPVFHLPSGFPRTTFFTAIASDILTSWPAHCSLLTYWYSCHSIRQMYE